MLSKTSHKKLYRKPRLSVHGTVRQLTQTRGSSGSLDGHPGGKKRTQA